MKYSLRSLMIVAILAPPLLAAAYFWILFVKWGVLLMAISVLFLGGLARLLAHIHYTNRDKI
jgi:hypothetical protein